MHPFDSVKYKRTLEFLHQKKSHYIWLESFLNRIHQPSKASRRQILDVMSWFYVFTLNYTAVVCKIIELPLVFLPNCLTKWRVLDPMLYCTQGSIDAACMAIHKGWAINIGGGYHHAHSKGGSGFCVFPDITMMANHVRKFHQIQRVMIVDLDAHQGNGHERDFLNDKSTFIMDAYNPSIFPGDEVAKKAIRKEVEIFSNFSGETYLRVVEKALGESFEEFRPEFIIYNAGTDCMVNDPLGSSLTLFILANLNPLLSVILDGVFWERTPVLCPYYFGVLGTGMRLTPQDIIKRDEIVFRKALESHTPIAMVLSGGYQKANAPCIADSIINLVSVFDLLEKREGNQSQKEQEKLKEIEKYKQF